MVVRKSAEWRHRDEGRLRIVRARALACGRTWGRHPKRCILIHNGGIATPKRTVTVDGLEAVFRINHLSGFLLTNLLLASVRAA
jgi:NAD(P)-dependent dehydrogenase (short-subunit alcohol dehydrogenase family)